MDRREVDRWLSGYVEAWRTYDRERIAALFSADAKYRYHPYDEWICGRDAIVSSWRGETDGEGASTPDQPGTWEAEYRTIAVDGDVAVAVGSTTYSVEPGGPVDRVYDNCFVLDFDADGRCRECTEWYVERLRSSRVVARSTSSRRLSSSSIAIRPAAQWSRSSRAT